MSLNLEMYFLENSTKKNNDASVKLVEAALCLFSPTAWGNSKN